jgi:ribosomal protein S13
MINIFGKTLHKKNHILNGFKSIYGLNIFQISLLLSTLNIGLDCHIKDISQKHVIRFLKQIEMAHLLIEIKLKQNKQMAINVLIDMKSNRGVSHIKK